MEMIAEYMDEQGFFIVQLPDGRYYYGDGSTVNAFGISANQFLRFHPYMNYVGDKNIKPSQSVIQWLDKNQ